MISPTTLNLIEAFEEELLPVYRRISRIALTNQAKVLDAYQAERIGVHHFQTTSGYGYHDPGRAALENVFARVFAAEAALVRQQLVSGTHAIACSLLGNLTPSDELLICSGFPYETLVGVLGIASDRLQSVSETGGFRVTVVPLTPDGALDISAICDAISSRTKIAAFQRSCGYAEHSSFCLDEMAPVFREIRRRNPETIIFVDNCYGEFVEEKEPLEIGADLIAGSLIKNPGGCLAPGGGYVIGKQPWVEKAAERLYAPKIGGSIGPSLLNSQIFFQGFYEAPHRVSDMVKGAVLAAQMLRHAGLTVSPLPGAPRTDIIQKIHFHSATELSRFCQAVQGVSPIESNVRLEPVVMPGYLHPVIMGGGTFTAGATSEFSVDAPLTPPYIAYLQGGLSYTQIKLNLALIYDSFCVGKE